MAASVCRATVTRQAKNFGRFTAMADPKKVSDPKFPYPEENAEQKGGASIRELAHLDAQASSYMYHHTYSMRWVLNNGDLE